MDPLQYFDRDLDDETKNTLLNVLGAKGLVSRDAMEPYFQHYYQEVRSSVNLSSPSISTHEDALAIFRLLKANVSQPKSAIMALSCTASALDLSVRAMLVTSCVTTGTTPGDNYNPVWKPEETLAAFIDRVYPRAPGPVDDRRNNTIAVSRMTAHALATDARFRIQWTNRLTDHLAMCMGADWKTIYIFRYPCYLKMCLKALEANKPDLDHDTAAALALYVLPPPC